MCQLRGLVEGEGVLELNHGMCPCLVVSVEGGDWGEEEAVTVRVEAGAEKRAKGLIDGLRGVRQVFMEGEEDANSWCQRVMVAHSVSPGKSWGNLGVDGQHEWVDRRCDSHFCEENEKMGRGVFDCVAKTKK